MKTERLVTCERRWDLAGLSRLHGGHRSDVFGCQTGGVEVVLKLTVTPQECAAEAAALAAWADTGAAVRLLDVDLQASALLLERLRPGTHLPPAEESTAVSTVAALLPRLHAATTSSRVPSLLEAYADYERRAHAGAEWEQYELHKPEPAGLRHLEAARAAMERLCATTPRTVFLHGDFIDKNLLWNGHSYVAIDPIPRVGDPCSDIGFFAAYHPPAGAIFQRARAIAGGMDEDPDRAGRWAAVWTVGEACETWRDDSADLQNVVSSDELSRLLQV